MPVVVLGTQLGIRLLCMAHASAGRSLHAARLPCISAFACAHTPYFGNFTNAGGTATGLDHTIGSTAAVFFAIVLLNASLIGAGAVTLATSYVLGDVFGSRGSLHRTFSEEK